MHRKIILPYPFCRIRWRVSKEAAEAVAEFMRGAASLAIGWAWEQVSVAIVCMLQTAMAGLVHDGDGGLLTGLNLCVTWVYTMVVVALAMPAQTRLKAIAERRLAAVNERLEQRWKQVDDGQPPTPTDDAQQVPAGVPEHERHSRRDSRGGGKLVTLTIEGQVGEEI